MNYAIIENGVVVNTVVWDGSTDWTAPTGAQVVPIPVGADVGIGSTYDGSTFTPPPPPPGQILGSV